MGQKDQKQIIHFQVDKLDCVMFLLTLIQIRDITRQHSLIGVVKTVSILFQQEHNPVPVVQRSTGKRPSLKSGFSKLRDFTIEQSVFYSPVPSLDIAVLNEPPILASPSDRSSTNKFSTGIGC